MPNVTTYIRREDKPKWDAIPNKSLWLQQKLNEDQNKVELKPKKNIVPQYWPPVGYKKCKNGQLYKGSKCTIKGCKG